MVKRLVDVLLASVGLLLSSWLLLPVMFLVWRQDGSSPFYISPRVGKDAKLFRMVKLRSMIKGADRSGVDSTAAGDQRITKVGHFIRRYKLDELTQLWNVVRGEMSIVGPRPNVQRETDLYTAEERKLLSVRPGITDFSSIVFADEGDILTGKPDPDLTYNQIIRPWKSRLGLFYVERASLLVDIVLIYLTALAIVSRARALRGTSAFIARLGGSGDLVNVALREAALVPQPPPGALEVVTSRNVSDG